MKPVNLNQLLFHAKKDSLSFYISPDDDLTPFVADMMEQLQIQDRPELVKILEKNQTKIKNIIKNHPKQSHGFYLSDELEGYVILENSVESFCIISQSFHVRPLLEEVFVNPEFMVINISMYDIKVYRGDFQHLEIIQQYEFDQLPDSFNDTSGYMFPKQNKALISYKTILAIKTIAHKVMDLILYHSLPVLVTGIEDMKSLFLKYFDHTAGVFSHIQEDFYEKTCVEISERCKVFRSIVMDYYSAKFKDRLKKMMTSKRLITDLSDIIKATNEGKVIQLVLPIERKLWGRINLETGEYSLHKKLNKKTSVDILNSIAEEVAKQGGRIQVLGPHFFPLEANALAILKG